MKLERMRFSSPDGRWEAYGFYPDGDPKSLWKKSMVMVLLEQTGEEAAVQWMQTLGLEQIVDREKLVVIFPQCRDGRWQVGEGTDLSPEERFVHGLLHQGGGRPGGWNAAWDVHHLVGVGSGGDLVCSLTAKQPTTECAASICAIGGTLELTGDHYANAPVPAVLVDMPRSAADYFCSANQVDSRQGNRQFCSWNPAQSVTVLTEEEFVPSDLWPRFCATVRRVNTSPMGDVMPRNNRLPDHAVIREGVVLSDGFAHDWIEVPPPSVVEGKSDPVPLILVSHGMGNCPGVEAETFGLHRIGQQEGFLTVYVYSSNRLDWNLKLDPDAPDDLAYYLALLEDLQARYPIDPSRIYTAGFSNGAGMAMLFALTHPELVAACFPVDSTFPYGSDIFFHPARRTPYLIREQDPCPPGPPPAMDPERSMAPLYRALELQRSREKPYRLPVLYFYGTREAEYPVRSGSNQELSYRFWKEFNGIPQGRTDDSLEGGNAVGVPGMEIRVLHPYALHPEHRFTEHVFYNEDGLDAYHFILMHGKGHEVHPYEAEMGWQFLRRFSRKADGSLLAEIP